VIKSAKFKFFFVSLYFHGTHVHILLDTGVPQNKVWETLNYSNSSNM